MLGDNVRGDGGDMILVQARGLAHGSRGRRYLRSKIKGCCPVSEKKSRGAGDLATITLVSID